MARQPVTQPAARDHEWAQSVDGADIRTPADALKDRAYDGLEIPDHRDFNGLFRDWDRAMRYWLERSVATWSSTETYNKGALVRYEPAGVFIGFFVAVVTSPTVGQTPVTNEGLAARQWERWYYSPFGGPATETDNTPIIVWRNQKSLPSSQIDRLGYLGGSRVNTWWETWRGSESISATATGALEKQVARWLYTLTAGGGGGQIASQDPQSTSDIGRQMMLNVGTGVADEAALVSEKQCVFSVSGQIAAEWRAQLTSSDQTVNAMGLADPAATIYADSDAFIGCVFRKAHADANWQAITGNGATRTIVDTGIAGTTTDPIFRVEYQAASMSEDATAQARFYINSARVARITTTLPSTHYAAAVLASKRQTGATNRFLTIRNFRWANWF